MVNKLIKNKIIIISDKNKKSIKIKRLISHLLKKKQFKKNLMIIIGGDGFMLKTLKKNKFSKKVFYGINSGNYGFLMNKFSPKNLIKNLRNANTISISPLEMRVSSKLGNQKTHLAINEVSILRQSRQAALLEIKVGSKILMQSHGGLINIAYVFLICLSNSSH